MGEFFTLNPHALLNAVAASTVGEWYPVDFKHAGIQQRSVMGTKHTSDEILIEVMTSVAGVQVIATATAWVAGVTTFSAVVQGPFMAIRTRKINANGAATVLGVL